MDTKFLKFCLYPIMFVKWGLLCLEAFIKTKIRCLCFETARKNAPPQHERSGESTECVLSSTYAKLVAKVLCMIFFTLASYTAHAESNLVFKQEPVHHLHWVPYILVFGILVASLFFLAKKSKVLVKAAPQCKIIEKMPIQHKTQAYIIEYQGQRFLIADNQNALAIHPLAQREPSS